MTGVLLFTSPYLLNAVARIEANAAIFWRGKLIIARNAHRKRHKNLLYYSKLVGVAVELGGGGGWSEREGWKTVTECRCVRQPPAALSERPDPIIGRGTII